MSSIIERFNVTSSGNPDGPVVVFAHGFGCDQSMWRLVVPAFEPTHRVILFDLAGCGRSDPDAYSRSRHDSLARYADDVLELCRELDLSDVVLVGHSVSAMVGVLAVARDPSRFAKLVLVGPSPRYIDDGAYVGGFSPEDIDGLLEALEANWLGWSAAMAPVIAGNPAPRTRSRRRRSGSTFKTPAPEPARAHAGNGPLPAAERARRDHRGDQAVPVNGVDPVESAEELYEDAPCGYLSTRPDGRILRVNRTFLRWTAMERDH